MPFTNIWSKVIPAGGVAAKLIDDHARQLRLDLEERLQILFEPSVVGDPDHPQPISFARDPLVLANAIIGKKADKKLVIPWTSFIVNSGGVSVGHSTFKITGFGTSEPLLTSIMLPPGCTLKRVEMMSDKGTCTNVVINIRKRAFAAGAAVDESTLIATVTNLAAGRTIAVTPDFAEVIDDDMLYYIEVDALGTFIQTFFFYGVRLTYDAPSALITI